MAEKLGEALLELRTDDKAFSSGITRAKRGAGELERGLKRTEAGAIGLGSRLTALGSRLGETARGLLNLRSAAVAAAGAAGLFALSKSAIAFADDIAKTARTLGISAEALQEWRFAAGRAGVETATLDRSLTFFTRTLGQAQRGMKTQADLFASLGVNVRDARGELRTAEAVLDDVVSGLGRMENQAQANSIAMELFGRGGARMATFLQQGSDEIDKLRAKAHELGIVISDEMAAKAEVAADELGDMGEVLKMAGLNMALEFMPVMRELANLFTSGGFQEGVRSATGLLATMIRWMTDNSDTIIRVTGALAGMRVGRMAGTPGMLVGGAIGAMLPELMSARDIDAEMAQLGAERLEVETQILKLRAEQQSITGALAQAERRMLDGTIRQRQERLAEIADREKGLLQEMRQRDGEQAGGGRTNTPPPYDPGDYGATAKKMNADQAEAERLFQATRTAAELYAAQIERLDELLGKGLISQDVYSRAVDQAASALERAGEQAKAASAEAEFFGRTAFNALDALISGSQSGEEVLDGLVRMLQRAALEAALLGSGPLAGLFGGGGAGGGGGILASIFSSIFTPRAAGGPLSAGQPAIIGELGPELWVPDASGHVVPHDMLAAALAGGASGTANGGVLDIRTWFDQGDWKQEVRRISGDVAVRTVGAATPGLVRQGAAAARDDYSRQPWGRR